MAMTDEARALALLALHQYVANGYASMEIRREVLRGVWNVDRWHEARIKPVEAALGMYFPKVKRTFYTGRVGMPGFAGFVVGGIRKTGSKRTQLKTSDFKLVIPTQQEYLYGDYSDGENDDLKLRLSRWTSSRILEYNLIMAQSNHGVPSGSVRA